MTEPTGKTYIIRTVDDLTQLDDRQLDACLKDLRTWVIFRRGLIAQIDAMKEVLGAFGLSVHDVRATLQDHMGWIDDGIEGGELHIQFRDEEGNVYFKGKTNINSKGEVQ